MKRLWKKIWWMTLTLILVFLMTSVPVYARTEYDIGIETGNIVLTTPGTYRITGRSTEYSILISPGTDQTGDFHIILDNVTIKKSTGEAALKIEDNCPNDVVIELVGKSTLTSPDNHAGIEKNGNEDVGMLTIKGDGELHAKGAGNAAGIGGGAGQSADKIKIISGVVKAEGKHGIGAGQGGSGGAIRLEGDIVTAIGSNISGLGFKGTATVDGDCVVMARGGGGHKLDQDNIIRGAFIYPGNHADYNKGYIKGDVVLQKDLKLLEGYHSYISNGDGKLIIPADRKITVPSGEKFETKVQIENQGTIENNGTIENKGMAGTINNSGTIINNGSLKNKANIENNGTITNNDKFYDYEGSELSGSNPVEGNSIIKVVEFNSPSVNGEANIKETDEITLTFNREVSLTADDIALENADLESVTASGMNAVLKIKNLAETGNVKVTLNKENHLFDPDNRSVSVNREIIYTVTFDANGGDVEPNTMQTVNGKIETPPTPTREGYNFEGWYIDQDCTTTWDKANVASNMTVYAKWTEIVYTVTFDANGGDVEPNTMQTVNGKIETPPTPTREGYDFEGWYTDQDCTTDWDNTNAVTSDMTVYAKWTEQAPVEYTVTFDANGGDVEPNTMATINGKIDTPPTPSREGFDFGGWYTDQACTIAWDKTNVTSDMTVYAKWTEQAPVEYTVTFDANGGTVTPESMQTVDGKIDTPPTPTREDFEFGGWYTDQACTTTWDNTNVTSDMTVYANWTEQAPVEYTVTFDANGGDVEPNTMQTVNGKIETPPTPTREDFDFGGWYTDQACTITWDNTNVISNMTVYANWIEVEETSEDPEESEEPEDSEEVEEDEESEEPEDSEEFEEDEGSEETGEETSTATPDSLVKDKDDKIDDNEHFLPNSWFHYVQPSRASRREEVRDKRKTSDDFVDVPKDAFYKDAIDWAIENNITEGTSKTTFSPNTICTRAETVTFLWRAAGKPVPTIKGSPFKDIRVDDYYYNAVLWAYEKGIINGVDEETFSPEGQVTRAQVVTIQWRADGKNTGKEHNFKDIKEAAYFEEAVSWALDQEITQGVGYHMFAPSQECTRGEIVTFLYRQFKMD